MLSIYFKREEEPPRLASNAFSWDEAIQFIKILVSVHGYDFQDIKYNDDPITKCTIFGGYAADEYCYVIQEKD